MNKEGYPHVMNERQKIGNLRCRGMIEVLVWLAGLSVLAANIVLLHRYRKLEETVAPQIVSGAHIEILSGLGLDGHLQTLDLPSGNSKLLIITFSPGCPACQANQERWQKLASALRQKGVRVIWFSRDPVDVTKDYCTRHGIDVSDVFADPPYRSYLQLGLSRVPNTLLVGTGGQVEHVWAGRLDAASWTSLFSLVGLQQLKPFTEVEVGVRADCKSEVSPNGACK